MEFAIGAVIGGLMMAAGFLFGTRKTGETKPEPQNTEAEMEAQRQEALSRQLQNMIDYRGMNRGGATNGN